MSESTIAMNTTDGMAVSTIPKYRNPNKPVDAAPIRYMFLRPMRSEMCPDSGMEMNDMHDAVSTAARIRSRDILRVPTA